MRILSIIRRRLTRKRKLRSLETLALDRTVIWALVNDWKFARRIRG